MSTQLDIFVIVSIVGLVIISVIRFAKNRKVPNFLVQLALLIFCGFFAVRDLLVNIDTTAKGAGSDIPFAVVLYGCMLFGMLGSYGYNRLSIPRAQRPEFDLGLFLAPMLASPLVFIPLLGAMQNADVDLNGLTTPKLMVFLVAFENGFFWKEYFDHRRAERTEGQ